jgi:hypothetical protein
LPPTLRSARKKHKEFFKNFQANVKMLVSLIVLSLQDLKATREELQDSNSMDSTTEVSNFGHYQLSEMCYMCIVYALSTIGCSVTFKNLVPFG